MELRHLRYFVALHGCLSFRRAAEQVHVTQSTLSHQIAQLESELGVRLFDRVGKRLVVTEAGDSFIVSARRALLEVDEGVQALAGPSRGIQGDLRIGTTNTFNLRFIPACVAALRDRHPTVRVSVLELTADGVAQHLADARIDVGVSYRSDEMVGLTFEALYDEQMVLVVSKSHRFAHRKRVRVAELHALPIVLPPKEFVTRRILDQCFESVEAVPTIVAQMNTITPMLGYVRRSDVATITSRLVLGEDAALVAVPLEAPTPMRTPGLVWRQDGVRSAAARSFASIVRRAAADRK